VTAPAPPTANGPVASHPYVSRGGLKLASALDAFALDVAGVRALDAGASTGGFTDCLLRRGAKEVVVVDVAYGQLAWELRTDSRVRVFERTNIRAVTPNAIGGEVDLVTADLSFISLRTARDALVGCAREGANLVLMVKPQFELPRSRMPPGSGGVVRDPHAWSEAVRGVADAYRDVGCVLVAAHASPVRGPKGNYEFFVHLVRGGGDAGDRVIERAVESAQREDASR
jgi:23S rRNA (cytidine1920-2'-O)/16S rRNA (cytidine1409-2'-O)-methyltransferase